jgi:hypothetical protein
MYIVNVLAAGHVPEKIVPLLPAGLNRLLKTCTFAVQGYVYRRDPDNLQQIQTGHRRY